VATIATTLPGSPVDGQEAILVDSLTAPTYAWTFKYVASISDANKWLFIGGGPAVSEVAASESATNAAYIALTTAGPSFTVPRAGIYLVTIGARMQNNSAAKTFMSYDIGGTAAADVDAATVGNFGNSNSGYVDSAHQKSRLKTLAAATALVAKYKSTTAGFTMAERFMHVLPVRVA
jgi:hypothetical protein